MGSLLKYNIKTVRISDLNKRDQNIQEDVVLAWK